MGGTAFDAPIFSTNPVASASVPDNQNAQAAPSLFWGGEGIMDPRAPYTYKPGSADGTLTYGHLAVCVEAVNAVPSALAANNIAASQVPVANTPLTLVSSTAAGITVGTSITSAATGATVTGLLAIDTAMAGVSFGQTNAQAVAIWDPTKAIARNVRITSVGDDSVGTFLVAGYDLYGYPMSELITGANAGIASGKKAFKYIASVTPAGTLSGSACTVGTGDVFGFPIRVDYFAYARVVWNNAVITANTGFVAAVTTSPATTTTGDVRGTYGTQSASDGTRRLQVFIQLATANVGSVTGLYGVTQV